MYNYLTYFHLIFVYSAIQSWFGPTRGHLLAASHELFATDRHGKEHHLQVQTETKDLPATRSDERKAFVLSAKYGFGWFFLSIYQCKLYYNDIYYNHYNSISQVNLL